MNWEILETNLKGVAVDVYSDEWIEEDIVNKTPVIVYKIAKRKGGFTLYMKAPSEELEWYFSKGLTDIKLGQSRSGKFLHIEHEDGIYWVDMQINKEVYDFLKDFIEDQNQT